MQIPSTTTRSLWRAVSSEVIRHCAGPQMRSVTTVRLVEFPVRRRVRIGKQTGKQKTLFSQCLLINSTILYSSVWKVFICLHFQSGISSVGSALCGWLIVTPPPPERKRKWLREYRRERPHERVRATPAHVRFTCRWKSVTAPLNESWNTTKTHFYMFVVKGGLV